MTRQAARLALELAAFAFLAAIFIVGFALYRLSGGPVDLEVLRPNAEAVFAEAFQGETVELGRIESEWRPESRAFVVTASEVVIRDEDGAVVSVASRLAAALPANSLAQGRFAPLWVEAEGGAFSVVRRRDGSFLFGLGPPQRAVAAETPAEIDEAASPLRWRRDDLPDEAANLRRISMSDALLFVQLRDAGLNWRVREAAIDVDLASGQLTASLEGRIAQRGGAAGISALVNADLMVGRFAAEGRVSGFNPSLSAPSRLAPLLRTIDAPVDASVRVATARDGRLTGGRLTVDAGEGSVRLAGRAFDMQRGALRARYEASRQALVLETATLRSDALEFRASGLATGLFDGPETPPDLEITAFETRLDLPGVFAGPLEAAELALEGRWDAAAQAFEIGRAFADLGSLSLEAEGRLSIDPNAQRLGVGSLSLEGGSDGFATTDQVLELWRLGVADGGRRWIAEYVQSGRVSDIGLALELNRETMARGHLDNDALALSFLIEDGAARFVSTMTPITGATARGVLRGNAFELALSEGRIGDIELLEGRYEIPRLNPRGAVAGISGAARAEARDVLALLDQEPFGFPSAFGIDPADVGGSGEIEFEISRPMRSRVPAERIGFSVAGEFADVSAPAGFAGLRITDGNVRVEADPDGLIARGPGRIGPMEAHITWQERFGEPAEAASTRYRIVSVLDQADFDALGLPLRQFLDGPVALTAETDGDGLVIDRGEARLDFAGASLGAAQDVWSKPVGEPADASFAFVVNETGFEIGEARIEAPGLEARGSARLSATGRLQRLTIERAAVEGFADLAFDLARRDEGLRAVIDGAYLDARWLVRRLVASAGGAEPGVPLSVEVALDRAAIADTLTVSDLRASLAHSGDHIRAASLEAAADGSPVRAAIEPGEGDSRTLTASAEDAGLLFEALFNIDQVRGGAFSLDGRSAGPDAPWRFETRLESFRLVRAPILARLFSLASLEGLGSALGGDGLGFERMTARGSLDEGRIKIDHARASGGALGLTTSGEIDIPRSELALAGVLIPSYGVNAAVGAVPVIGDILTSREGEGVFALTYSINGPFQQTQVIVNPLSALAPGILRRVFEGEASLEEAQAEAAERPPEGSAEPPG